MNRRNFLRSTATTSASLAFAGTGSLLAKGAKPANWRTFEVITRVEVLRPSGTTKVWLPASLIGNTPFQKTLSSKFSAGRGTAEIVESRVDGLGIITAEFPVGVKPIITLTSRVATRNYTVDFSTPDIARKSDQTELQHFLRPTRLLPTDGIVKTTAAQITRGLKSDLDKARAIYEWVVENTF